MNPDKFKADLAQTGVLPIQISLEEWLNGRLGPEAPLVLEWIKALRSGKYAQGEGYLRAGDAYCCLGVLCEVAEVPKVEKDLSIVEYDGKVPKVEKDFSIVEYDGKIFNLPLGMTIRLQMCPNGRFSGTSYSLAGFNDEWGFTFNEIADVIESYPHLLFYN